VVYIVTYDLKSPNDTSDDYKRVMDGLKSTYGAWCHLELSVWLVAADQTATEVRDEVKKLLNPADRLFVARLSGNWGSFNLGKERNTWLKQQTF
jgi:hypothetical protein